MSDTTIESGVEALLSAARAVRLNAYAPYSSFLVGAALLADDGKIYFGCNVENAAYPEGTCAEAGAIAAMIAGGAKRIQRIAVVADGQALVSPCGGCRQKLVEFGDKDVPVYLAKSTGPVGATHTLAELLPASFSL